MSDENGADRALDLRRGFLPCQSESERKAGSKHECVAIGAMFEGNIVRPRGKLTAGGIYGGIYRLKIGGQE